VLGDLQSDLERCAEQLAEVGRIEPMPLGLQDGTVSYSQKTVADEPIEAIIGGVRGAVGAREFVNAASVGLCWY